MKYHIIPDHEKYKISPTGEIVDAITLQSIPTEEVMVNGYKTRFARIDGCDYDADRLILITFIGDMPSEITIRYTKGNPCGFPDYQITQFDQLSDNEFMLDGVLFRRIPDFDNYIISTSGIVYSLLRKQFVRHTYNHAGYQVVPIVRNDNYRAPQKVHRLVYSTYIGNLVEGLVIDHIDGVRYHNNITNLQQITDHENVRKAFYEGAAKDSSRWDLATIHKICELLELGYSNSSIAAEIGYDYNNGRKSFNHLLFRLRNGAAYTDVTSMYDFTKYNSAINRKDRVLHPEDVAQIKMLLRSGEEITSIARMYNCTTSTITKIRDGKTWKHVT